MTGGSIFPLKTHFVASFSLWRAAPAHFAAQRHAVNMPSGAQDAA
jgi:hypothetical protein